MTITPPKRSSDLQQRLIVLYILKTIGECSDLQLASFLCEYQLMNYFDMMFALNDLSDQEFVRYSNDSNVNKYRILPAGEFALDEYLSRLPVSIRQSIDQHADDYIKKIKQEQSLVSSFQKTESGWELSLKVLEHNKTLLAITMLLPSQETTIDFQQNWQDKAQEIFAFILHSLSSEDAK